MKDGKILDNGKTPDWKWKVWEILDGIVHKAPLVVDVAKWVKETHDKIFTVCGVTDTAVSQSMNACMDTTNEWVEDRFNGKKTDWFGEGKLFPHGFDTGEKKEVPGGEAAQEGEFPKKYDYTEQEAAILASVGNPWPGGY